MKAFFRRIAVPAFVALFVDGAALADFTLDKRAPSPGAVRDAEACKKSVDVKACLIGKMSDRLAFSRAAFDKVFTTLDPAFRKYLAEKCRDPRPFDQWETTTAPEKVIPCYANELANVAAEMGNLSCSSSASMWASVYSSMSTGCISVVPKCGNSKTTDFAVCPCKGKSDETACAKDAMKNYFAQATFARSAIQRARSQSESYSQDFANCTKVNNGNSCIPGSGSDQAKVIQPAMYGPFLAVNADGTGAADAIGFKQPSVDAAKNEETNESKRDGLRKNGDPGADSDSDPGAGGGSGLGADGDGTQTPFSCDDNGNAVDSCPTGGKPMDGSKALTVLGIGDGASMSIGSAAKWKILQKYMMTIAETYYSLLAKQSGNTDENFNKKADALPEACSVPLDATFGLGTLSGARDSLLKPIAQRAKDKHTQDAKDYADAQKKATGGMVPLSENDKYAMFAAKAAKELCRLDNEIFALRAAFPKAEYESITAKLPSWMPCQTFFRVAVDPVLEAKKVYDETRTLQCGAAVFGIGYTGEAQYCSYDNNTKDSHFAITHAYWCGSNQKPFPAKIPGLPGDYKEIHNTVCGAGGRDSDDLIERLGMANADTCNATRCRFKSKYLESALEQKQALLSQFPELATRSNGLLLYNDICKGEANTGPTIKGLSDLPSGGFPPQGSIDKVTAAMAPLKSNDKLDQLKGLMATVCKDPDGFFNNLMGSPEALRGLMNCSESPDLAHAPAGLETAIQSAALCKELRFSRGEVCQIQKAIMDAKESGVMNAYNAIQPVVATAMDVAGCLAAGRAGLNGLARIASSLSAGGEVGQVVLGVMRTTARNMVLSIANPAGVAMMVVPSAFDYQNLKTSKEAASAMSSACLAGIVKDGEACKAAVATMANADKEFVHGLFIGFLAAGILHEEGEGGTKFSQLKDSWEKGGKSPEEIRPAFEKFVAERTGLPTEAVHSFAAGMTKADFTGFFEGKVDVKIVNANLARMKELTKGKSGDALKSDPQFLEVRVRLAAVEEFIGKGGKLSPADSAYVATLRKIIYDSAASEGKQAVQVEVLKIERKKARLEELQRRKKAGEKLSAAETAELQKGLSVEDRAFYDGYAKLVYDDVLGGKDPATLTAADRVAALEKKTGDTGGGKPGAPAPKAPVVDHEAVALGNVAADSPIRDLIKGINREGEEGAAARKEFIAKLVKAADELPEPAKSAAKAQIAEVIKLVEDPALRKRLAVKLEEFAKTAEEALTKCP